VAELDEIDRQVRNSQSTDSEDSSAHFQKIANHLQVAQGQLKVAERLADCLYRDTNGAGRDRIRKSIAEADNRLVNSSAELEARRKVQDAREHARLAYNESLAQASHWMESAEDGLSKNQENLNWLSVQEVRSRAVKVRSDLAEAEAAKCQIEHVSEKAAVLVQCTPEEKERVQGQVDALNAKHGQMLAQMRLATAALDDSMEAIQQYQDVQKTNQDWLKQMWQKLLSLTDVSGSKILVETRLNKLNQMSGELNAGQKRIEALKNQLKSSRVPPRIQEAIDRDVENLG